MYTHDLDEPACALESEQPFDATPRVAVLASKSTVGPATTYAEGLGRALGKAGVVVVAGAHSVTERQVLAGACRAQGKPWLIEPVGSRWDAGTVRANVSRSRGSIVRAKMTHATSPERASHEVACALASTVVVIQSSSRRCPSLRSASAAFLRSKRVWVVPPSPWMANAEGSLILLRRPGIRPLWRTEDLLVSLGVAKPISIRREDPHEQSVVDALKTPLHKDQLLAATKMTFIQLTMTLFELMVDGTVREGLDGRLELAE